MKQTIELIVTIILLNSCGAYAEITPQQSPLARGLNTDHYVAIVAAPDGTCDSALDACLALSKEQDHYTAELKGQLKELQDKIEITESNSVSWTTWIAIGLVGGFMVRGFVR